MARCLIACGSNLGDRARALDDAVCELQRAPRTQVETHSRWHETKAVGGAQQPSYLNGAIVVNTELGSLELLTITQQIEARLGRAEEQRRERWGVRTIDLDLLLYEEQMVVHAGAIELPDRHGFTWPIALLEIPHPRLVFRRFVLEPASEIAGNWRHPLLPYTLRELQQRLLPQRLQPSPVIAVAGDRTGPTDETGPSPAVVQAIAGRAAAAVGLPPPHSLGGVELLRRIPSGDQPDRSATANGSIDPQLLVILADLPVQVTGQPECYGGRVVGQTVIERRWWTSPRIYVSARDADWAVREIAAIWTALQPADA